MFSEGRVVLNGAELKTSSLVHLPGIKGPKSLSGKKKRCIINEAWVWVKLLRKVNVESWTNSEVMCAFN